MDNNISFGQYKGIDLAILTIITTVAEALTALAASKWFPTELYSLSPMVAMVCIVMMRWGAWAVIPTVASSLAFCVATGTSGATGAAACKSQKSGKNRKPFSRISDFKGMKADVNSEKLVVAIMLDIFLWSWLLPSIAGMLIAMFFGGLRVMFEHGFGAFGDHRYHYVSQLFLCTGFSSLGGIICIAASWLIKLFFRLIRYIIVLHYKAIYNV